MRTDRPVNENKKVKTISREDAVFWMDDQGRWHNQHGPFEHKAVIAYFNASIDRDEDGYFVSQSNGETVEKVYFSYQDTAIFVVDVQWRPQSFLLLNTGLNVPLVPGHLYIEKDQLYVKQGDEIIKFTQKALLKMSEVMDDHQGAYWLRLDGQRHRIAEK